MSARFVFHDAFATGEATFDQVRVLSTQGERVKLRFITADDRAVDVILDKAEMREMVTWDMLR